MPDFLTLDIECGVGTSPTDVFPKGLNQCGICSLPGIPRDVLWDNVQDLADVTNFIQA